MMSYIDTSALAAYYCPETLSRSVEKELRRDEAPTISPLVEVEFHSAVALKVRTREFDPPTANRIVSLFRLHLANGHYRLVAVGDREYGLACDWIGRFSTPLRTLDALHLAAAFASDLVILTTDRPLARSAKHFGVKCKLIS
jgi:predicted nucleic acid-binding protein